MLKSETNIDSSSISIFKFLSQGKFFRYVGTREDFENHKKLFTSPLLQSETVVKPSAVV